MTGHVREGVDPYVESGRLPGYAAGVSISGETGLCAAGTVAIGSDEPIEPARTIFRLASLSKPVGGALALTLVQSFWTRPTEPSPSARLEGPQREPAQAFLGSGRSRGYMVEVLLEPDDSGLPAGSFGWMGGTGTTAYVDPSGGLAAALFTQRAMETNRATAVFKDFWRAVYRVVS